MASSPAINIDALESEFQDGCLADIEELRALGYYPTRFVQMVGELGAREAARRLINSQEPPEGFYRLWEMGRLGNSVEAYVYNNRRFWVLFDSQTLTNCENRLREVGYLQPNMR
jgi:hypothetical protein